MSTTEARQFTADELLALPVDGVRRELVAGDLREMPPAGSERGFIQWRLASPWTTYGRRSERIRAGRGPDLAVEVISPSDRYSDVESKVREWLDAGTRLVWVVDPATRSARIHRMACREEQTVIDEDGRLDGEDVVPGFSIRLGEVFPPTAL